MAVTLTLTPCSDSRRITLAELSARVLVMGILTKTLGPQAEIVSAWQKDAHADDGDVRRRCVRCFRLDSPACFAEDPYAAFRDVTMQFLEGDEAFAHRGRLADHIHPLVKLLGFLDVDQVISLAHQAFGGYAQASQGQAVQGLTDFLSLHLFQAELAAGLVKFLCKGSNDAP